MTIRAGIVGAAGFAGIELVRLLSEHPEFELVAATSDSLAGTRVSELYPALIGHTELVFTEHGADALSECDAVFLAVPHTAAMAQVPALLEAGITVFDLSADYRLHDPEVYERWYATEHTSPELLEKAAFGLPELFRDDLERRAAEREAGRPALVACAGCYPTATSLAAYPAVHAGMVSGTLIVDAISGVTGAGKKATERTHFCFANESVEAYGVGTHRHTPEIEQILRVPGRVVFTPHLAPLNRGILSTVYLPLDAACAHAADIEAIYALYTEFYRDDEFVQVLPLGSMPKTRSVAGSNSCHIGLALSQGGDMLIAVGAIDNLCKGAAGQAVQCANIVFGLSEGAGLTASALPV
ncbi:N-acetyl-gamma-glutamyl-phosphate reductase [Raoultibacter phocaeensis]|uniref:N-acetyl-gamma-glutamyl-phosphate reductase n=1 Tax=Raoultibacter phocaeensis TaxID=2479841 RepID=UPI00111A7F89|nr:N-acetyl-gamma-glutamyl-phosphate reductase [Raoultibacter phocaeensis]